MSSEKDNRSEGDLISNHLRDNPDIINLDCYTIKNNTLDSQLDFESKEIRSDLIYLKMAETWGSSSHCKRMQVGCLVVKNKSIISDGYNGSPSGFPNVCESEDMVTLPYVLHAEANAITKLAKSTQSSMGSTMYVTLSPCYECAKLIIQSGIKRIVFCEVYRNTEPLLFLSDGGIEITRISQKYLSKKSKF